MSHARGAVYARLSLDRLGTGENVADQEERGRALAEARGIEVATVQTDNDTSAKGKKRRPGFETIMGMIEAGTIDVVIARDMDRLLRSARDRLRMLEAGKRKGVLLAFWHGQDLDLATPSGRLTAEILGAVALAEIEMKADRQVLANLRAVQAGRRVGGRRPFGYGVVLGEDPATGKQIIDYNMVRPDEAELIRRGYDLLLSGGSLRGIARLWNAAGASTPQGNEWHSDAVRYVLANPRYAGLRGYGSAPERGRRKITASHQAVWPAIVGEDTWRAAEAILSDPQRATYGTGGVALLTGVAECGVCGGGIHGGANRYRRRTYRCAASVGHVVREQASVDEWVTEVVLARLGRPDAAVLLVEEEHPDLAELRSQAHSLRSRRSSLARLLADGTLSEVDVRKQSARLTEELAKVEHQMAQTGRMGVLERLVSAGDVRAVWDGMTVDARRLVVGAVARVVVHAPGRGTRIFRPETVEVTPRDRG